MSYSAEVLSLSPQQFLKLQESSGDAIDSSGNGNTAFYDGTPALQQPGLIPNETAYSVDCADVGWVPSYTFDATTTYTACGWAYRAATTNADAFFGDANTTVLQAASGSTNTTFWSDINFASVSWTGAIPTAIAFHWAVTYNQSIQTAELYINGLSLGTRVLTNPMATPGDLAWGISPAIGNPWNGRQSHDAWFSRVLSSVQIMNLYQAALVDDIATYFTPPIFRSRGG